MKNVLVILGLLVVCAVIALGVFWATFDADRYRPLVVSRLEEAIGRPVALERITLGWERGIAIRLQGLAVSASAARGGEPSVSIESISAVVRVLPLLRKQIEIASLVLQHPRLLVTRNAAGQIDLLGLAAAVGPAAMGTAPHAAGSGPAVTLKIASLRVREGVVDWVDATTTPPTHLSLNALDAAVTTIAPGAPMEVALNGALASPTPNLHFTGRVRLPDAAQPGSVHPLTLRLDRVAFEDVLPPAHPGAPSLRGALSATFQGTLSTLEPSRIQEAMAGSGTVKITGLVVSNLNILRAALGRFVMLPGLLELLEARLAQADQAQLLMQDTRFKPVQAAVEVEGGAIRCDDVRLQSEALELSGGGRVGLDGGLDLRSVLRIGAPLSAAFIHSAGVLQGLANEAGELEFPVTIQRQGSRLTVSPDLHYLTSRLVATSGQELLGRLLERALESHRPAESPTSQTP